MRHISIPKPDPDLVVWRYMPFSRFEYLVRTKEIFLARLDLFDDTHEGYIPAANQTAISPADIASQRHAWAWRFITYASCWHIASKENPLMWPAYGADCGVVIKSTAGKLEDIASFHPNAYTARVI